MKRYFSQANQVRLSLIERVKGKGKQAEPLVEGTDADGAKLANAIARLKGRDRVGVASEGVLVAGSTVAGAALSGVAAGAVGATSLLGSTSLAGLLGGVFVTTTPVGWVIGSAAIAGAAGFGVAKLIRSGARQDRIRTQAGERLATRLDAMAEAPATGAREELLRLSAIGVEAGQLSAHSAAKTIELVDAGVLNLDLALRRVSAVVASL